MSLNKVALKRAVSFSQSERFESFLNCFDWLVKAGLSIRPLLYGHANRLTIPLILPFNTNTVYSYLQVCSFARLFAKLFQPRESEGPLRSSSQDATCYYHSKVEAIPLSGLPNNTSELAAYLHTNPFKC